MYEGAIKLFRLSNLKKRLNIVALSRTSYWHGMHGGMDVHGKLLAEGLCSRGHRVTFFTTRHPSGKTHEINRGVELYYLPDTIFGSRRHGWAWESVRALEAMHREKPFDLIWSQSYDGFGVTRAHSVIRKIPMLATLHGSIQQEFTTFLYNLRRKRNRPLYSIRAFSGLIYSYFITQRPVLRHARCIVTVSRIVADDLRKWFGQAAEGKCVTIYNGIDTERFRPDPEAGRAVRSRHAIREDEVVLLSLGRLTCEKGHHLLIEILDNLRRDIPGIRLLIVGEGEYLGHLQAMAGRLGLSGSVIFTGPVDNVETASYYNASDIFVFPTLTVEGLPFVVIEAMACGRPVIASEIGGTVEVIRNGENGILVKPGDRLAFTDNVAKLISDRRMAECLGRAAEATAKRDFCIKRMIDLTETRMIDISAGPIPR